MLCVSCSIVYFDRLKRRVVSMENSIRSLTDFSTSTLHVFIHSLSNDICIGTVLLSLTIILQRPGYLIVPKFTTFEWNEVSMQPSLSLCKEMLKISEHSRLHYIHYIVGLDAKITTTLSKAQSILSNFYTYEETLIVKILVHDLK